MPMVRTLDGRHLGMSETAKEGPEEAETQWSYNARLRFRQLGASQIGSTE